MQLRPFSAQSHLGPAFKEATETLTEAAILPKVPEIAVLALPGQPASCVSAEIIYLPAHQIGKRHRQRVKPLARDIGDRSPDLKARKVKQTEKPVAGLPGVVEITHATGKRVWFLRYVDPNYQNPDKRRRKTSIKLGVVGEMTYIDMVALAKRYRDDIAAGRSPRASRMSLETFVRLYFEPWVRQNQRSSQNTLGRLFRYLLPLLGDKALGDINLHDGERLIASLLGGSASMRFGKLSNATTNRVLMACWSVFRRAVELGFIAENPFKRLRRLKESPPSPKALETDELGRLLAVLEGEPLVFVLLVKLLLATGARISEILGLQDSDVDYPNAVLHLRMTKAGEAQTLPITASVAAILEALKPLRRPGNPHLFPAMTGDGHMVAPYKRLRKVLAAAGLEMAGFHLFRKTVGTQAMQLPNMDVLTVSRLLRHKSVRTLEVHYLATPQKRLRQAAADIGERLVSRPGKEDDMAP